MKKYIALTSLLAAGALCANAEEPTTPTPGTTVFNFGGSESPRDGYMDTQHSDWQKIQFSNNGDTTKEGTKNGLTLRVQGGSQLAAVGPAGSFTANSAEGSGPYVIGENLKALSTAVLGSGYDNLWGGATNAWTKTQGTITLSGLQQNWDYEIYLLSARANNYNPGSATDTTWTIAGTNISGVQVSTTSLGESPSNSVSAPSWSSGATSGTVKFDGSQQGKNATIVGFKFNSGTADSITLTSLDSSNFTLNGFVVKAIPEPSMFGLLAGMGALALVSSRRRRK